MPAEQDIIDTVDEIVDDIDPVRIEREADRLGLSTDELIERVLHQLKTRVRFG
jgi:hypothetical protein